MMLINAPGKISLATLMRLIKSSLMLSMVWDRYKEAGKGRARKGTRKETMKGGRGGRRERQE